MTFLYPYFLLLLLVPFVFSFFKYLSQKNNVWAAVCDAHLLPFLTVQVKGTQSSFYKYLFFASWFLACICMAGPAVLKKDTPTAVVSNGIVVVLDMSPAMDKEAIEQMTRKLYDLISLKKDASFGLVLVDEKAYTALPITQDKSIFQNIIPDLKERIMPSVGQNIEAGIKRAEMLLEQGGFKNGQILLITAGVENVDNLGAIKNSTYPVHVLGVGKDTQKHPVTLPNGQFWGGSTPVLVELDSLSRILGSQYHYASLDESDLRALLKDSAVDKIEQTQRLVIQYQNLGIYGTLLLLPFVALLFRKGVLLVLFFCFISLPSYAGFWWRTEQELYQKQMQGVLAFNVGQYKSAQEYFNSVAPYDVEALYNLGNAQAYAGKIQEAIATYEKVLQINPEHEDAAHNLEYLKKQLPPPPEQESSSSEQNNEQSESSDDAKSDTSNSAGNEEKESQSNDDTNEGGEEHSQPNFEQKTDMTQEQKNNKNSEGNEEEQQQAIATMQDISEQSEQNEQESLAQIPQQDQKQKEWLDQIKPDAGRVLRYRLFKQYREQQ